MPAAELFTRIDELAIGDRFSLQVLGENLIYEVDKIDVVLPHVLEGLAAVEGEDFCTLVTCTPYGINTHRLLVRGRRIPAEPEPVIDDPAKRAARASLIQQMRASDLRYFRHRVTDDLLVNLPVFLVMAAAAVFIHFLRRGKRRERWARAHAATKEEMERNFERLLRRSGMDPTKLQTPGKGENPEDWWNG